MLLALTSSLLPSPPPPQVASSHDRSHSSPPAPAGPWDGIPSPTTYLANLRKRLRGREDGGQRGGGGGGGGRVVLANRHPLNPCADDDAICHSSSDSDMSVGDLGPSLQARLQPSSTVAPLPHYSPTSRGLPQSTLGTEGGMERDNVMSALSKINGQLELLMERLSQPPQVHPAPLSSGGQIHREAVGPVR